MITRTTEFILPALDAAYTRERRKLRHVCNWLDRRRAEREHESYEQQAIDAMNRATRHLDKDTA